MIPKPRLFQQTGYFAPKVSLEPLVAVPMYIDAREPKKLQTFPEISRNHAKTAIPGQKRPTLSEPALVFIWGNLSLERCANLLS
jgi:hypothetical protein